MKFWYNPANDVVIARIDDESRLDDFSKNIELQDYDIKILTSDTDIDLHVEHFGGGSNAPTLTGIHYMFLQELSSYGTVQSAGGEFIFTAAPGSPATEE